MTLPRIHHVQVAIPAGGEDAARTFFGEILGLREVEKPTALRARGGVWFETGNLQLHLGVDPAFRPATKAHVALEVQCLNALRDRLIDAGHRVQEDVPLDGFDRLHVDDPFGNRTELVEAR